MGAAIKVEVINASTVLTDTQVKSALSALQTQVNRDFAPVWGTDAELNFVANGASPNPHSWHLVILNDSDEAGTLGYHDTTAQGLPIGKVFAGTDLKNGSEWTVTASHELLEMLADPDVNLSVLVQKAANQTLLYAYEVCDPCEPDNFGYEINGIRVSDFLYPTWFETFHRSGTVQFDHCKHINQPFQILEGGYINIYNVTSGGGWQEAIKDAERLQWNKRAPVGSRRERRKTHRTHWLASTNATPTQKATPNSPIPEPGKRPVLQKGSSGEWVICLQNALNGSGVGPLVLDGDFGNGTDAALQKFQQSTNLTVNGIADATTWSALDSHPKQPDWLYKWPSSLNLTGAPGADTMGNVTATNIREASRLLGATPRFWGRYFVGSDAEYRGHLENKILHDNGIRVAPVCRETNLIHGNSDKGRDIGSRVTSDILLTFGEDYLAAQGGVFYVFLDTEPAPQPALSTDYYLGWSKAVVSASKKVKFLPAVYINHGDDRTANALKVAMQKGAQCYGLWVANYGRNSSLVSPWRKIQATPAIDLDCPVLVHQYIGDVNSGIYDFNEINPYLDAPDSLVLNRLILPPG
jgi:hypothetical protein